MKLFYPFSHLRALTAAVLLVFAQALVATAAPPIALDTRSQLASSPGYFRLRITVEPDARNRYLCLQWVQTRSGNAEHTGCWEIQAEREPRTTWKDLKELPAGKYAVVAWVIRNDEQKSLSNPLTLIVTGLGYEPDPPLE